MSNLTLDAVALRDIIVESGVSFKESTRSYIFECPKCGKPDKLYILKTTGAFICWVCAIDNFKGRAEFALTEITSLSITELRTRLYGLDAPAGEAFLSVGLEDWAEEADAFAETLYGAPKAVEWPLDYYPLDHHFCEKGRAYLASRGITLALAHEYDLRYSPPERRVAFPVKDRGVLVGWQARAIFITEYFNEETGETSRTPKILSSESLAEMRDRVLMFSERLVGSSHAVLCEGPVDGLKAHLCGGNVVTMGKVVHQNQIALIRNSGIRKIYLALDPDAAWETAKLVREIGLEMNCYQILPPPGREDLGASTPEEIYGEFLRARPVNSARLFIHLRTH